MQNCANKASSLNANPEFPDETTAAEQFYSIDEIATRWKVSRDFVRRAFAGEAGVLVFGNEASRGSRRRYTTMRIPVSVLGRTG
jgi:hypothetical protein